MTAIHFSLVVVGSRSLKQSKAAIARLSGSSSDVMLSSVSASMPPLLMSDSEEDTDSLWTTGMTVSVTELVLVLAERVLSSFTHTSARCTFLDFARSLFSSFCKGCKGGEPTRRLKKGGTERDTHLPYLSLFLLDSERLSAQVDESKANITNLPLWQPSSLPSNGDLVKLRYCKWQ